MKIVCLKCILQVLQQWMSVIRAPSSLPVSGTEVSESNGDSNGKENVSNNGNVKVELLQNYLSLTALY